MGLSVIPGDGLPAFSSDVLRLEIQGPDEEHLSIIDVPGIVLGQKFPYTMAPNQNI
jgi:hypothetical protein